ncbi:MAG: hypothetical protein QXO70_03805 [Candidatus Pacearchaeota archaeon]
MGWLEKKPTSAHRDIRLVKKEGNDWLWLDGKKENSEINFAQAHHTYLNFTFSQNKIYSVFRQNSNYKSKVYKNGKWVPISEKIERDGNYFINSQEENLQFLVVEDIPIFVFMGFNNDTYENHIFISGLFDELE